MPERTCNRCNRPLIGRQTKYCSHTCANRDNMGRRSRALAETPWATCQVEGCNKPARSRVASMCPMHYHRQYRYGTLRRTSDLVREGLLPGKAHDVVGHRFGTLTAVRREGSHWICQCDCGETRKASLGELNRTGDANTCGNKANHLSDDVEYSGLHERVRAAKGPARRYDCVDCGTTAAHWSYNHADPNEKTSNSPDTRGAAFSLNVDNYEPRCARCHKRFDLGRINGTHHRRPA